MAELKIPVISLLGEDGQYHDVPAFKGEKGDPGPQGPKGEPGKTPQKGTDYLTPKEVEDLTTQVKTEAQSNIEWDNIKNKPILTTADRQMMIDYRGELSGAQWIAAWQDEHTIKSINQKKLSVGYSDRAGITNSCNKISIEDTRDINSPPGYYLHDNGKQICSEFKYCNKIEINPSSLPGTYCSLITISPWSDDSGGLPVQLAMNNGSQSLLYRLPSSDSQSWQPWHIIGSKSFANVSATGFSTSGGISGYPYRGHISLSGVTDKHFVSVVFNVADTGNFAPIAQSYNGGVYVYATYNPGSITVPSIVAIGT